jgi:hypothetical protein
MHFMKLSSALFEAANNGMRVVSNIGLSHYRVNDLNDRFNLGLDNI